jgi:hypothetical protein
MSNSFGAFRPPAYCENCGESFPWRAAALAQAEKIAKLQAETYALDVTSERELTQFAKAVADKRVTPQEAATFGAWFKKKFGSDAARAVGGALKDVATSVIADAINKAMLGR